MRVIVGFFFLVLLGGCSDYESNYLQGYIEGEYTQLSTVVSGRLQRLYITRGETVAKGQKLFELEPEPELSQLNNAVATLEIEKAKLQDYLSGQRLTVLAGIMAQRDQAQAELELAQSNYARIALLYQKKVVSRANYDDAVAQVKSNQERVNQFEQNLKEAQQGERQFRIVQQTQSVKAAEAEVAAAKWRLDQKSTLAPDAGLIQDTFYNEGEEITANEPVASLLTPRYVYLVFYIPEPMRAKISINDDVRFDCDGCKQTFSGVINYISSQAEYTPPVIYSRESRSKLVYRVQAKLPMALTGPLYPGEPVEVYIKKKKTPNLIDNIRNMWRRWLKK